MRISVDRYGAHSVTQRLQAALAAKAVGCCRPSSSLPNSFGLVANQVADTAAIVRRGGFLPSFLPSCAHYSSQSHPSPQVHCSFSALRQIRHEPLGNKIIFPTSKSCCGEKTRLNNWPEQSRAEGRRATFLKGKKKEVGHLSIWDDGGERERERERDLVAGGRANERAGERNEA